MRHRLCERVNSQVRDDPFQTERRMEFALNGSTPASADAEGWTTERASQPEVLFVFVLDLFAVVDCFDSVDDDFFLGAQAFSDDETVVNFGDE